MKYRPEIDGLRAIAVMSVFFYHLGLKKISGGFVGVDIFFVISGFLITSIIYKDLQRDSFTFRKFYERRIRRIIPALYVVLFLCLLFTLKFFMVNEMENFAQSLLSSLLFYSNMLFWNQAGYFDLDSAMKPLLHTWSLSIEEQFYIFFPGLLLLLYKKCRKYLIRILVLLFSVSFVLSVSGAEQNLPSAFYFVHARAWELLLGALLALGAFPKVKGKCTHEGLCLLGLGMIGYGIFAINEKSTFPGFNAAIPCFGTAMIIYSVVHDGIKTWCGKLLSSLPFTFLGKISYSLYLWHWPTIVFTKYVVIRPLSVEHRILIFVFVMVMSFLSWKFVEQPVRTKEGYFKNTPRLIKGLALATLLFSIVSVTAGYVNRGFPGRLPPSVLHYAEAANDINPDRKKCHVEGLERSTQDDLCKLGESKGQKPLFVVWGDSHADAFMPAFKVMAEKNGVYGLDATHSACPPLLGVIRTDQPFPERCDQFNEAMMSFIERHSIPNVILVSHWATGGIRFKTAKSGTRVHKKDLSVFATGLDNTLKRLYDNHSRIWVVKKIPTAKYDIPSALGRYAMFGKSTSKLAIRYNDFERQAKGFNSVLNPMVEKYDLQLIDLSKVLCSEQTQQCAIELDGKPLYRDHHHLSNYGAVYLSPFLQPFFDDLQGKHS